MNKLISRKIEEDLDFLKCHLFRLSQIKWGINKNECLDIFIKNKLFKYIDDNYEYIHMQGLDASVNDLEVVIKNGKCKKTKK